MSTSLWVLYYVLKYISCILISLANVSYNTYSIHEEMGSDWQTNVSKITTLWIRFRKQFHVPSTISCCLAKSPQYLPFFKHHPYNQPHKTYSSPVGMDLILIRQIQYNFIFGWLRVHFSFDF